MIARVKSVLICALCLLLLASCDAGKGQKSIAERLYDDTVKLEYRTSLLGAYEGELTEKEEIRAVLQLLCELPMTCDADSEGLPGELYTPSMIMGQISMQCSVKGDKAAYGVSVTKTGLVYITVIEPDGRSTVYYTEDGAVEYEAVLRLLGAVEQ